MSLSLKHVGPCLPTSEVTHVLGGSFHRPGGALLPQADETGEKWEVDNPG